MIRVYITARNEDLDTVLERLCFAPVEELEVFRKTETHTIVTTDSDGFELDWADISRMGLSHTNSVKPNQNTPPFHIDVRDSDVVAPSHHGLVWDGKTKFTAVLDELDRPFVCCHLGASSGRRELVYHPTDAARAFDYLAAIEDGGFCAPLGVRPSTEEVRHGIPTA